MKSRFTKLEGGTLKTKNPTDVREVLDKGIQPFSIAIIPLRVAG